MDLFNKEKEKILNLKDKVTDFDTPWTEKIYIKKLPEFLEKNLKNKNDIEQISFESCDLKETFSLQTIDSILENFPNCKFLNLSFNRFQPNVWSTFKSILEKRKKILFDISYTPLASIDSKFILSSLGKDYFENLIWIPKEFLDKLNWVKCLDLKNDKEKFKEDLEYETARSIKKFHKKHYELTLNFDD